MHKTLVFLKERLKGFLDNWLYSFVTDWRRWIVLIGGAFATAVSFIQRLPVLYAAVFVIVCTFAIALIVRVVSRWRDHLRDTRRIIPGEASPDAVAGVAAQIKKSEPDPVISIRGPAKDVNVIDNIVEGASRSFFRSDEISGLTIGRNIYNSQSHQSPVNDVTIERIFAEIDSAGPYQKLAVSKLFNGIYVTWRGAFLGLNNPVTNDVGSENLRVSLSTDRIDRFIFFVVSVVQYPRFKILRRGDQIEISGTITAASDHYIEIDVNEIKFL